MVTLKVKLPAELRKTMAFTPSGGADGNFQALLYVKRGSDGTILNDALGKKAGYIAPINSSTGEATFKLPPLPATTIDPAATPGSTNAYRFEIKVFTIGTPPVPSKVMQAADDFQHLKDANDHDGAGTGTDSDFAAFDADGDLTSSELVASGEAFSTVVAGLPTAISVPRIYLHAGTTIDSFAGTKQITFNTNTVQDDEIRFRLTKVDTDKFSGQNTTSFTLSGAAGAGTKLSVELKNGNATYVVDATGATLAALHTDLKAELDSALGGDGTGTNAFYTIGGTSPTITLKGKTSSANLEGSLRDVSSLVATGSINGGVRAVAVTPAKFDIDLTGSYNANEVVNLTFADTAAAPVTHAKSSIASDSAGLDAIAAEIAKTVNADAAFKYSATAAGSKLSFTAKIQALPDVEGSDRTVNTTSAGVQAASAPTAVITTGTIATDQTESSQGGGSGSVTYNKNSFRFTAASEPTAGNLLIIKSKKPDGSDGPTFRYVATAADAADTDVSTYIGNITTAANSYATSGDFALAFTASNDGTDKLMFTSNFYPGHTIATASMGVPASGVGAAVASTQTGVDGVLANSVQGTFTAQVAVEADAGDDDAIAIGNELTTKVNWTDKNGVARSVTKVTTITTTATDPGTQVAAALTGDAAIADYFTITAPSITTVKLVAKSATMDDTNPASSFPISIARKGTAGAALAASLTNAETAIKNFAGLRALRVLCVWPSDTTFSGTPSLTATDGSRTTGDVLLSLGKFLNLRGTTTAANSRDLDSVTTFTRLLDLDASNSGATAPIKGPWNFSLKLNSGGKVPTIYLMDLDTAEGAGGSATGQ